MRKKYERSNEVMILLKIFKLQRLATSCMGREGVLLSVWCVIYDTKKRKKEREK